MDLHPTQKKQLDVWSTQRDALLREITVLTQERDVKLTSNISLAESNTDLSLQIAKSTGRLEELKKIESERVLLLPKEIVELEARKATLVAEIPMIEKKVGGLKSEKNVLVEIIDNLTKVHTNVLDRIGALDKIVEHVTRINEGNITDFKVFFDDLKKTVVAITDGNKKVIEQTEEVIARVPTILKQATTQVRVVRPLLNKKRLANKGKIPE